MTASARTAESGPVECAAGRPVPERCAVLLATLLQYAKYPATPNSTRWVSFILPDDFLTEAEDALADALAPGPSDRMPPAGIELSGSVHEHGMSLRDYFAAKALPTVYSNTEEFTYWCEEYSVLEACDFVAQRAYQLADAMLAARQAA